MCKYNQKKMLRISIGPEDISLFLLQGYTEYLW